MGHLFKACVALALLGLPLLVVSAVPRLFDLVSAVPSETRASTTTAPAPAFHLMEPTPATSARKFASLEEAPPPTLAPAPLTAAPVATPRVQLTGERITIGNTGGRGAVLRAEPVSGQAVAALRDGQVLDVLERQTVAGSSEWIRVRTSDGREGWVTSVVAVKVP
ncbi:MAG: hypothetical protein NVSMB2_12760 [Chloroflexota bacterium]